LCLRILNLEGKANGSGGKAVCKKNQNACHQSINSKFF
jgi:hypothetical protein